MRRDKEPEHQVEDLNQYDYFNAAEARAVVKKYAHSIGVFLINFSELEHILNLAIAEILGNGRSHDVGYVVIESLSTQNKIELFHKTYTRLAGSLQKSKNKVNSVAKKLKGLNKFRSSLVHANWLSVDSVGFVRTKLIVGADDGYVRFRKTRITPPMIAREIKVIQSLTLEIPELYEKFLFAGSA